jgi:uncharacterized membrane protein
VSTNRIEFFSDGVFAIVITIMVLDLHTPVENDLAALRPLAAEFATYVLSFMLLGIYWTNHHHLLQASERVNGTVLWANLHLLFWLSLVPFTTRWMGEQSFAPGPVVAYGAVLLGAALAWNVLSRLLVRLQGADSRLATALGSDRKALVSLGLLAIALPLALVLPWASVAIYVLVNTIWFDPDRRIEVALQVAS